ncbi:MAG: hypothetical protein HY910_03415 [Desulfarculus sp.]|nr:hypothetical protein [Desulfarculus sp.]
MNDTVDMRSLNLAWSAIAVTWVILMLFMQRTRKTYPGFGHWTLGTLASCLGLFLIASRGHLPLLLSLVAGNLLLVAQVMFFYRGLAIFVGRRPSPWTDGGLLAFFLAAYLVLTYALPSIKWRIILFSSLYIYYFLRCLLLAWHQVPALLGARNWLVLSAVGLMAAFYSLRTLGVLLWDWGVVDILAPSPMNLTVNLATACLGILTLAGLIFLNVQRLEMDLQSAQREVGLLGGLLPICAKCKRIRDDGGYWHQVERYISAHSDANFTHGICPQCLQDLYPEVAGKVLPQATTPETRQD